MNKLRTALRFKHTNIQGLRDEYKDKRNTYKNMTTSKKKQYRESLRDEVLENKGDSTKFWKAIKGLHRNNTLSNTITIEEWLSHFKDILNPKDNTQNTNTGGDTDTVNTTQGNTMEET